MTVAVPTPYAELAWTGVETSFSPGIYAQDKGHIVVRYVDADGVTTTLADGTHLTLSKAGAAGDTGAITAAPVAMPPAPGTVTFERVTPPTQATSFEDLLGYSAKTHERLHDAAALRAAEADAKLADTLEIADAVAAAEAAQAAAEAAEATASTAATTATSAATTATSGATTATTQASNAASSATSAAGSAAAAATAVASFTATSVTSLSIAAASKTFVIGTGKVFAAGDWVRAESAADTTNFMAGPVTAYSGGNLTVDVQTTGGSGTHADWTIRITGQTGAPGAAGPPGPGSGDMLAANNLSDLASAATARSNLGLGNSATKDTGTSAGTVAAGDDSRITGAAQKSANLSDLASASTARTNLGLGTVATLASDTDGTLAANSDSRVATQKATKTYVDALLAANDAMVFKGATDCSGNPNYPAADAGHTYRVSVAGKIGGASGVVVEAGDYFICNTDSTSAGNQATVGTKWNVIQTNIDGAVVGPASATDGHIPQFDGTTGKLLKDGLALDADGTLAANSDTRLATQKAVKTYADSVGGGFPSNTLMLFQQTAAPTGWTKQTTHDDKALRVVSGTPSSGGATAFSSVFGSGKVTGSSTVPASDVGAPAATDPGGLVGVSGGVIAGSGHTHTLSLDLKYVDVIIAKKD